MQEVTCFRCRTVVEIAPDDDHCANCGEDLRGLLDAQHVSDFFCARVAELKAAGRPAEALAEAERGLAYHDMAELHLLAAILAEEMGRFDLMRSHVAAIPLGDSLRPEAEWLLRAHQDRQRALREGARHGRVAAKSPPILAHVLGTPAEPAHTGRHSMHVWTGAAAVLIVTLLLMTFFVRGQRSAGVAGQPVAPEPAAAGETASSPSADLGQPSVVQPAATPQVPAADVGQPAADPNEVAPVQPTPTQRLLPIPTPSVPQDLVLPANEGEAIVDSNPRSVVVLSADGFDLARVLRESGYVELAELPIDARLQDGKLVLNGIVHMDLQRRQILEALASVPGIADVSATNLLLRPKPTYTVQPGDTMWSIAYDIYGDAAQLEAFTLANLDVVPSPDALRAGIELRVPPNN